MTSASIRLRSALILSGIVTLLWLATAGMTARLLSAEMDEVFDSALQETGQRILQLAVVDVLNREEEGITRRVTALAEHEEHFTYILRNGEGAVLLTSHRAEPEDFPLFPTPGFHEKGGLRFYQEAAVRGTVILTIAEPLSHRREVAVEMGLSLSLPLLVMVPLSIVAIFYGLGIGLQPLDRLRAQLAQRGAKRLSPIATDGVPRELQPVVATVNDLLSRLEKSFAAERSFAANAAHELRTPLAGALAQVQRLQMMAEDEAIRSRAVEIEATLKRLTRLSEKLMQLARAEGARLLADSDSDMRAVLGLVIRDFEMGSRSAQIALTMPETAVLSAVDPDAVAIVARNLVENALRHGAGGPVHVTLDAAGCLMVENDGSVVPVDRMAPLTERFVRGDGGGSGSGLGLAIVNTIAERIGSRLVLQSPIPGRSDGFRASIKLRASHLTASDK